MRRAGCFEMAVLRMVAWEEDGGWLGYLQDYPDYWTQGDTREELGRQLAALHRDITSGSIPGVQRGTERESDGS